jgi:hypothetical protein
MRRLLLPSFLLVCQPVLAQEPTPAPTGEPTPPVSQTELRAQSMRQQIGEGRQVQSHVRVRVRLTNGNRITGVVKDGRLVERIDGLRFVEANAADKGAGVRIWYTTGARDFVFVPFRDFAEYEIVQKLSNSQLQQVETEMAANLGRKAPVRVMPSAPAGEGQPGDEPATEPGLDAPTEPRPDGAEPPTDQGPAGGAKPGATKPAGKDARKDAGKDVPKEAAKDAKKGADKDAGKPGAVDKDQQKAWFDLVQAYPPDDGWGAARRDEIKRRFVVIGSKPSAVEQRFVDEFEAWQKACAYFGVEPSKAGAAAPAGPSGSGKEKAKEERKSKRGKGSDAASGGSTEKN